MKTKVYFQITLLILMASLTTNTAQAQCMDWVNPTATTGWTDFNGMFGGAPCDDGTGCPFNEFETFEVFASEAYSVDNFIAGGVYSFSMCNGPGAGTWVPDFTIIAPSGAVDAFGAGDGDSCTITWTASESGTYFIVINEEGECGGGPNVDTANGFPALTCSSGAVCEPVDIDCNAGILTTTGTVSICSPDGTFDVMAEMDTVPTNGGTGWIFSDQLEGTGGLAGGFTLINSSNTETFDSDVNGVLSSNGLPVLSGPWVVFGVVYTDPNNATSTICSTTSDSLIVYFGTESPSIDNIEDSGNGSATVTASGGVSPYTYLWDDTNAQTTETAIDLDPGSYSVTVSDANGCSVVGIVDVISTDVDNIKALNSLLISPNPTKGKFIVELSLSSKENVKIDVMDVTGKTLTSIEEKTIGKSFEFNLSGEPVGVYFIKITVGEESLARQLILAK